MKLWNTIGQRSVKALTRVLFYPFANNESRNCEFDFKSKNKSIKGIALIIAILGVSMVMIFSSAMIVTSAVNLELASSHRDDLKAEYMAKSAFNLGMLLLAADFGLDLFQYQTNKQTLPTDSPDDIWSKLNGFPIGGESLEMLTAMQEGFDLNAVADEGVIAGMKQFDGSFVLNVADEASKINVSRCSDGRCTDVMMMLEGLMSCPPEKVFLDKKNIIARQLAFRVKDWIDQNSTAEDTGLGDEDSAYLKKNPPYSSKNSPLDSVSELKLIEGWDDDVHAVFSPYLTIYPFVQAQSDPRPININTVKKELLGCLVPTSKTDCSEKFFKKLVELEKSGGVIATDTAGVQSFMRDSLCDLGGSGGAEDKSKWFGIRSDVFRLSIEGNVGYQVKNLEAVIERTMPDPAKKIEASYRILYWRMM